MLGIGMAALTRQPYNCEACDETTRKPWDPYQEPEQQQCFENPEDCFWRSVYGEHHNDWYIVKIKPVGKDNGAIETDIAEARHDILHHVASAISETMEKEKLQQSAHQSMNMLSMAIILWSLLVRPILTMVAVFARPSG